MIRVSHINFTVRQTGRQTIGAGKKEIMQTNRDDQWRAADSAER